MYSTIICLPSFLTYRILLFWGLFYVSESSDFDFAWGSLLPDQVSLGSSCRT